VVSFHPQCGSLQGALCTENGPVLYCHEAVRVQKDGTLVQVSTIAHTAREIENLYGNGSFKVLIRSNQDGQSDSISPSVGHVRYCNVGSVLYPELSPDGFSSSRIYIRTSDRSRLGAVRCPRSLSGMPN